jgi:hypothetical protein
LPAALDAAQRAAEEELTVNEVGLAGKKPVRSFSYCVGRHHRIPNLAMLVS